MFSESLLASVRQSFALTFSIVETNANVFQLIGSPVEPVDVFVTIEATAEITGFVLFGLHPGSYVTIVNLGYLLGTGGDGGRGIWTGNPSSPTEPEPELPAVAGAPGGTGLFMPCSVSLNTDDGFVYAGGGGGGGGGGTGTFSSGGGGGGGVHNGTGGQSPLGPDGVDSTTGPTAVPGTGAAGQSGGSAGGDGGDKGEVGGPGIGPGGQSGGSAGLGINKNSFNLIYSGIKDEGTLVSESRIIGAIQA